MDDYVAFNKDIEDFTNTLRKRPADVRVKFAFSLENYFIISFYGLESNNSFERCKPWNNAESFEGKTQP